MKSKSGSQINLPLNDSSLEPRTNSSKILRLNQVQEVTGLGRSLIYQLQSQNLFPQSIKIGIRAVGWVESEVQQWIAKRIAQSRATNGGS